MTRLVGGGEEQATAAGAAGSERGNDGSNGRVPPKSLTARGEGPQRPSGVAGRGRGRRGRRGLAGGRDAGGRGGTGKT